MGINKLTIRDVPLYNQTVLVRTDYDVPVDLLGIVSDDSLIKDSLPTLKYLLDRGCKVVVISHMNSRIDAKIAPSLELVAHRLANLLGKSVRFSDSVVGDRVFQAIKRTPVGEIIVLENLNLYPNERLNDRDFAEKIFKSTGARFFVQDSPNISHISCASNNMITLFVPSVAGLLLEKSKKLSNDMPGISGLLDDWRKLE